MSSFAFTLILFSSIMHALYNLLIKRSRNKTVFIWWLFAISSALFTLALPVLPGPFLRPDLTVVLLGAGGAFCFVLYHLLTGKAYRYGDISVTYPLSQTAMLYLPLWGIWFFGEHLNLIGSFGIFMVAAGAYLLQMKRLGISELLRPFGSLVDESVQAALAAGFAYSMGAVIDKTGVSSYPPLYFTYVLVLAMLGFMTANLLRPFHRPEIMAEWRKNYHLILAGAPLMVGSFLSFRVGLSLSPMSYAIPVRQSGVLVGVLVGNMVLGEQCGSIRFLASLLILAGVFLVRMG